MSFSKWCFTMVCFFCYREKNSGFLALQNYEVTVLAFMAKYKIQWIAYFNYNGLSALFIKQGIQRLSFTISEGLAVVIYLPNMSGS